MKKHMVRGFGVAALLWLGAAWAGPVEDLQAKLDSIKTFKANFVQKVVLEANTPEQISQGVVMIQKPSLVRWQVDEPQKQLYITDGKTLWQEDAFLEQVVVRPLSQTLTDTPILLLTEKNKDLNNLFYVSEPSDDYFVLQPQYANQGLEWIHIHFKEALISSIDIKSNLGQVTHLTFSNVQTDLTLNAAMFKMKVPKGYTVLKEE